MVSQVDDSGRNCNKQNCHRARKCESKSRQSKKTGKPSTRTSLRPRPDRALLCSSASRDDAPHRLRNFQLAIIARVDFLFPSQCLELSRTIGAGYQVGADLLGVALWRFAIDVLLDQIQTFITLHRLNPHIRTDSASHLDAPPIQIRLQLRNREPSDLGNLFVAALMKNLERKNHPLIIIKSRQRAPNYSIQFPVKKLIDGRRSTIAQIQDCGIVKLNSLLVTRARSERLTRNVLGYA